MTWLSSLARRAAITVLGFLLAVTAYVGVIYLTGSNGGEWGTVFWIIVVIPACVKLMDRVLGSKAPVGPKEEPAGHRALSH